MSESHLNLYAEYAARFPAPEAPLLSTPAGDQFSYADAERFSANVAAHLTSLGLQPGDRVTVQVEKSPCNLWLFLGVIRAGLIYHPLNSSYTDEELRFFLHDAAPSLVVCDGSRADALRVLCDEADVASLAVLNSDGSGDLSDLFGDASARFTTVASRSDDVAALVYSSGTTGQPKGIMLTHSNLASNATTLATLWGFTPDDCLLHMLPIFHVHGLFVAIGCVLMSGASMRWHSGFSAEAAIADLPLSTAMMGVPTYYTRLLGQEAFTLARCSSMRLFISGSAPLLPETFAAFEERTGHRILERYGMTETGMNTSNPLRGERRAGTVGLPLPGVSVRVCDADHLPLDTGQVGDVEVRGPNVFKGYWNQPLKTADDFTPDGYFVTGDKGVLDAQGYLSIVGRSKDMVISGGLNVYPREIELLLDAQPGVLESAVIGLPDGDLGERVVAVVVPDGTVDLEAAVLREAVRARAAGYKVPKQVVFQAELPRNTMGKVQKNRLRTELGQEISPAVD